MSPGVNDGPSNTGAVPKSNRRSDRNRERSAANQQITKRSMYHGYAQLSNNLFQIDWQPVSEREPVRTTKDSNTRLVSSARCTSYQDIPTFVSLISGGHCNYTSDEQIPWQKMSPPSEQTYSPPRVQSTKPNNVDKMPDRAQVESRLNQIKDYIRVTSTMMDSLNQSSDPRARTQREKLGRMVEDLQDSERKLSKLFEQYARFGLPDESGDHVDRMTQLDKLTDGISARERYSSPFVANSRNGEGSNQFVDENGDALTEAQLRKKMEESQRKLAQLQEHQANLVDIQMRVRERLNEARQAQQALLQQENQLSTTTSAAASWESGNSLPGALSGNVEQQLESETAALRDKLTQLQMKKKHMDHLVSEMQAVELSDKGSCSSEGSRNVIRDKAAELEAMKAQLAHMKSLMEEATRMRECGDSTSEPEPDGEANGDGAGEVEASEEDSSTGILGNSFDRQSDIDETSQGKHRNSGDRPTVEEIQAITRELKEQSVLLQAARAELQRLKQPQASSIPQPANAAPASTPPPSLVVLGGADKKQSNNATGDAQPAQLKRRQLEDLMRKEQGQASNASREASGPDWGSQRGSNSQLSHASAPGNLWPLPANVGRGSNEQSVDGISTENLLDIGPQPMENGFNGNFWACPTPSMNQLQHGSTEYYRQLLLGSQAQQLQMMGTTLQQCCQLLWAQQRELQSMRSAIGELQLQLRRSQASPRVGTAETQDDCSNLSRSAHHLGDGLDAALPPSSSLPNLVSLPNSAPAPNPATGSQQQQLNNQVPPGNRANNYWDNFRSYSRQNLLSGNVKTMTDVAPGPAANTASTANAASGGVNSSNARDKRNREQGADNLPLPTLAGAEAQYSLNYQVQSNLQQQERESAIARNNNLTNDASLQQTDNIWDEAGNSFRLPLAMNDDFSHLSAETKEALDSLISSNRRRPDYLLMILKEIKTISEDHKLRPFLLRSLRALQSSQSLNNPLNEAADQTASESCQSSDEDSEAGAILTFNAENSSSLLADMSSSRGAMSSSMAQLPLIDHLEMPATLAMDGADGFNQANSKPGCNEDLAEADQSRPESAGNQQIAAGGGGGENDVGQEEGAAASGGEVGVADLDGNAAKAEDERSEESLIERLPPGCYSIRLIPTAPSVGSQDVHAEYMIQDALRELSGTL